MFEKRNKLRRGRYGRVKDVQFMEVEFDRRFEPRMVIEVEEGLRLLVADDAAVELAARLLNSLAELSEDRVSKGGRK